MRYCTIPLLLLLTTASQCGSLQAQQADLYRCEGCEAIHEHSFDDLKWKTTITTDGEPLVLDGTVYLPDGKTPAADIIVYAYHTNPEGVYPTRGDETGWARRHGFMRGWVKTDADGRYRFRTIRPGSYPGRSAAAHIHMTVKEPDRREYWIDEIVFEDDPLVDAAYRRHVQNRGGSGIIALERSPDGTWTGTRDIILEIHPE